MYSDSSLSLAQDMVAGIVTICVGGTRKPFFSRNCRFSVKFHVGAFSEWDFSPILFTVSLLRLDSGILS
jgi:hypothetical protein